MISTARIPTTTRTTIASNISPPSSSRSWGNWSRRRCGVRAHGYDPQPVTFSITCSNYSQKTRPRLPNVGHLEAVRSKWTFLRCQSYASHVSSQGNALHPFGRVNSSVPTSQDESTATRVFGDSPGCLLKPALVLPAGHRLGRAVQADPGREREASDHATVDPVLRATHFFATVVWVSATRPGRRETKYSEAPH